jgi:hypothetical protein
MTQTYLNQLRADEARVAAETPAAYENVLQAAERAGRYAALAQHYAGAADYEAANRQRILRDPANLVTAYFATRQCDDEFERVVADLLDALRAAMGGREYSFERAALGDIAHELRIVAEKREQRRAEDLDAPAAAQSDEAYDRKVDSELDRVS